MLSRVLKLVAVHCGGIIPQPGSPGADEERLREATLSAAKRLLESVDEMRIDLGLAGLSGVLREANRYLEKTQPWALAKSGDERRLGTVLYCAMEALRIVSGMLYPVMPGKMIELRESLGLSGGQPDSENLIVWQKLKPGARIGGMTSLFPRIPVRGSKGDSEHKATKEAKGSNVTAAQENIRRVGYGDFEKVRLKTARIIEAKRIEGSDKLLRLQIEVGNEKRQIVAGIARHYQPAELMGKTIVIVANLEPIKVRGVESDGMLLAASNGKSLQLLTLDGELPSGSAVK